MGRVNGQREFVVCMYKYGSVEPFWGTSGWRIIKLIIFALQSTILLRDGFEESSDDILHSCRCCEIHLVYHEVDTE